MVEACFACWLRKHDRKQQSVRKGWSIFTHTFESLSPEINTGMRIAKCGQHVRVLYSALSLRAILHRIGGGAVKSGLTVLFFCLSDVR